jgi:hypothetical protein
MPIAKGKTLVEGTVADTCEEAGMRAVCSGPSGCEYNSDRCVAIPLESAASTACNTPMYGLSAKICNGKHPRQCPELDGLFNYKSNYPFGEVGIVGGSFAYGNKIVAGDYYGYCIKKK